MKLSKIILFNILFLMVFLMILELFFQIIYIFFHHGELVWKRDVPRWSQFTPYGLYEYPASTSIPIVLKTDDEGFVCNGYEKKYTPDEYQIVLLGGSTVEGRGATSGSSTIAAHLEKILQKKHPSIPWRVINGGVSGYQSFQQMQFYCGKILQKLDPKIVVEFDGRNDAFYGISYADHGWKENWQPYFDDITQSTNDLMINGACNQPFIFLKKYSGFLFYFDLLLDKITALRGGESVTLPQDKPPSSIFLKKASHAMLRNHRSLAALCEYDHRKYIYILQPVLGERFKTLTDKDRQFMKEWDQNYLKPSFYWESLDQFYSITQQHISSVPNAYDESLLFQGKDGQLYFDSCHYTDKGNQIIAERIANIIEHQIQF